MIIFDAVIRVMSSAKPFALCSWTVAYLVGAGFAFGGFGRFTLDSTYRFPLFLAKGHFTLIAHQGSLLGHFHLVSNQ